MPEAIAVVIPELTAIAATVVVGNITVGTIALNLAIIGGSISIAELQEPEPTL